MEKLDIHNTGEILRRYLEVLEASSMSELQKKNIKQLIRELQIGKAASTKVKNPRLIAYLQFWLKLHEYFGKDFHKVNDKEVEKFTIDLETNKIKRANGLHYKDNTKNEFIKAFKRYMGWYYRDNKDLYGRRYRWIKEYKDIVEKKAISLEKAETAAKNEIAKNTDLSLRNATLFMFLFDSGCRIEEALNLKISQIEKHERNDKKGSYYLVDIKVSKTLPRRISVPLCTSYMTKWLQNHPFGKPDNYLFPVSYDAVRKILKEMSGESLGFKITPHDLRHSSATYYCKKIGNPYKFCYRYGWKFGSKEANRYIDRNLLGEEEQEKLANIIENDKIESMEKEFETIREENKVMWGKVEDVTSANMILIELLMKSGIKKEEIQERLNRMLPGGRLPRLTGK